MAPSAPERIRLEDILLPLASTSAAATRRMNQTARKSTGGKPPRRTTPRDSLPSSASPSPGPSARKYRKLTNGTPSMPGALGSSTSETSVEPSSVSIRTQQTARKSTGGMPPRKRPASATPDLPEQPTPSTSRSPRTTQTARKSTGGAAPRRQLSGPYPSPSPSHHDVTLAPAPEPEIPCDLCKFPRPPHDPSLPPPPAHTFKTTCRHLFHHYCYMNYLVVAPGDGWAHCPRCRANMLTRNRLWVDIADNAAPNPSYLDLTEEVEARRHAVRQAKEQVFRDMLVTRNFLVAASLLTGPDAVDVNCRSPLTGQTMLHFCAMANDVDGVAFLLQNGADKSLLDDAGLLAIDRARSNNAWNSANLPA